MKASARIFILLTALLALVTALTACDILGGGEVTTAASTTEAATTTAPVTTTVHVHKRVTDPSKTATCTETGLTRGSHCATCGEVLEAQTVVPAKGHLEAVSKGNAATCTKSGLTEGKYCERCDEVLVKQTVIPAKGHRTVTDPGKAATCTESGLTTGSHCSDCWEIFTQQTVIPAKGHTPVTDPGKAATCTQPGLTVGSHCSTCSATIVKQTVIPAKGHTPATLPAKAATCTQTGLTAGSHCSTCSAVLVARVVIPALGHTPVTDAAVAPTCAETGLTEGSHCKTCSVVLTAQTVVDALGHDEIDHAAKAPTCTEIGYDAYVTCSRCDYSTYAEKAALGHDEIDHAAKAPTCTESGHDAYVTCSRCDYTTYAEKAALGHDEIDHAAKAPTCTEIGYDAYVTCSRCDYSTYAEKAALGHDEINHAAQAPTCTESGHDAYVTCSRTNPDGPCSYSTYVEKTALGHSPVTDPTKIPTCTETGLTEGSHCSTCGEVFVAQEVVDALGHSYSTEWSKDDTYHWHDAVCGCVGEIADKGRHKWDDGVLQNAEGCSADAVMLYTCTDCRATREVAATTHVYTIKESTVATCTENGYTLYVCSVCRAEELVISYATGHAVSYPTDDIAPTCTEAGMRAGICDYCQENVTLRFDATGHTPGELVFADDCCGEIKLGSISCTVCDELIVSFGHNYEMTIRPATCTEDGARVFTCALCADTYEERIAPHGHHEGDWQIKTAAGCTTEGLEVRICSTCGSVTDSRAISAHGHSYESTAYSDCIVYTCAFCSDSYTVITKKQVTISFVTGGEDCAPLTVEEGSIATLPTVTREGYTFIGWYFDAALENRYHDDYAFTADITLYAAWAKNELSGSASTNTLYTDVALDFTFRLTSDVPLTDDNLSQYVYISDRDGNTPVIYITATEGNTYTIGGDYVAGMTYVVRAIGGASLTDTTGNEMWFLTAHATSATVKYLPGVHLLHESELYGVYEDGDEAYLMFRRDLLDVGDVAVIYGDRTEDILLILEVMAEGRMDAIAVYRIEIPDTDEVFEEYEVYFSGELDASEIQFADDLAEQLTEEVMASPLYAQFSRAATTFAYGVTVGDYYYDFNGISVKPNFKVDDAKVYFTIKITAEYARMHTETREVEGLLHITLQFENTLTFSAPGTQFENINNFTVAIAANNNTNIKLFASLGDKGEGKEELSHFKNLFLDAKDDGEVKKLDSKYAEHKKEMEIASFPFIYCGITFTIDVTNTFNFSVVGELGLEIDIDCTATFGIQRKHGQFSTIHSFKSDVNITFWMLGKICVSDTIGVRASLSFLGVANAYIDASVGPYFEVAGMLHATYATGQGGNAVTGGYLEVGVNINAKAGTNAGFDYWWLGWKHVTLFDKKWTIIDKNFPIFTLGQYDLTLGFKVIDTLSLSATCGKSYSLGGMVDKTVLIQDLKTLKTKDGTVDCTYYLMEDYPGLTLSEAGVLRVDVSVFGTEAREIKIKVVSGDIRKIITLTLTPAHNSRTVAGTAPTCTETGLTDGSKCTACSKTLVAQTVIAALGHTTVTDAAVAPTCTETGLTEGSHCSVCKEVFVVQVVVSVDPDAHAVVTHAAKAPTCTAIGWDAYATCSRCDYTTYKEKMALGHIIEGTECTVCHVVFNPSKGIKFTSYGDGTCYVSGIGTCTDNAVVIPSASPAGDRVIDIGSNAFENCSALASVTIPSSVTSIGSYAFRGCSSLTSIGIPATVTSIGNDAFSGCGLLIQKENGVSYVGGWVVDCDTTVNSVVLREGTVGIVFSAFYDCNLLESITLPFVGATLDGTSNTHFGYIFGASSYSYNRNCVPDSLKNVVITGGTSIGDYAFYDCDSLSQITIPASVTSVGSWAFEDCSSLTSIVIPSSVTSIDYRAFYYCTSLTTIEVDAANPQYQSIGGNIYTKDGKTLVQYAIGKTATHFEIPSFVSSIYSGAFCGCDSLTSITIPSSVTSIGLAFEYCDSLAEVHIDDLAAWFSISFYGGSHANPLANGANLYLDGTLLTEIEIPSSVTSIGMCAFYGCRWLTSIEIPSFVTSIGSSAFVLCDSLTTVTFAEGSQLTSIGSDAFDGCSSLTEITIPASVTSIGRTAFMGCDSLTIYCEKTSQPSGWGSSWNSSCPVVWDCRNNDVASDGYIYVLMGGIRYGIKDGVATVIRQPRNITVADIVASITYKDIKYPITSIGPWAFAYCSSLTSITIPASVTSIGDRAFLGCSSLTSIALPESVVSIGEDAFDRCNSLTIYCEATSEPSGWISGWNSDNLPVVWGSNNNHVASDGYVYVIADGLRYGLKDGVATVVHQPSNIRGANIPETIAHEGMIYSVTSIAFSAFSGCGSLESITLPFVGATLNGTSNTHFGYIFGASSYSYNDDYVPTSLKTVVITGGTSIGDDAFAYCYSLTKITIPTSVTSIGDDAFRGCDKLIQKEGGVHYVDKWVVDCDTTVTAVTLRVGTVVIGDYAFEYCSSLTSITIPATVTSIGERAFSNCDSLTTITFAEGSQLASIGERAFRYCSSLTSIEIPASVTGIGSHAFYECRSLTSIEIPDSVTSIGRSTFYGCSSLESITLPFVGATLNGTSNTHFGYIFGASSYSSNNSYVPTSLKTIVITGGTSIGDSAFCNCNSLTTITFTEGSQLTSIGYAAFEYCYSLTSIEIPATVTSIGDHAFYECRSLASVTFVEGSALTSIGAWAFGGCSSLTSIEIPASVTSIGVGVFSNCSSLTTIEIPASVTSIGRSTFYGCSSLTEITIPASVTSIGDWAFSGGTSLTIYCEAASQPSGWSDSWNSSNRPVVWGYAVEE